MKETYRILVQGWEGEERKRMAVEGMMMIVDVMMMMMVMMEIPVIYFLG